MKILDTDKTGAKQEPHLLTNIQVLEWINQTQARHRAEGRDASLAQSDFAHILADVKAYLAYPEGALAPAPRNARMRNCAASVDALVAVLKAKPYSLPKKYILQIFNLRPDNLDVLAAIFEGAFYEEELGQGVLEHVKRLLGPMQSVAEAEAFAREQNKIEAEEAAKEKAKLADAEARLDKAGSSGTV